MAARSGGSTSILRRRPAALYDGAAAAIAARYGAARAPSRLAAGAAPAGATAGRPRRTTGGRLPEPPPGQARGKVDLARFDYDATFGREKDDATDELPQGPRPPDRPPDADLGGGRSTRVLIVLQGIDAAGKDGTITGHRRRVQPAGLPGHVVQGPSSAASSPTTTSGGSTSTSPGKGEIGIFNRSHYEDVLSSASTTSSRRSVWRKRYEQIRDFERMLTDEGDDDRQVLPGDRPRRAARPLPGPRRRPDEALEVQPRATSRSASSGTTTARRSRSAVARRRPTRRRGT